MSTFDSTSRRGTSRISRRDLLLGMAGAGGCAALASLGYRSITTANPQAKRRAELEQSVPFLGIHQAGILTPSPEAALVAAFDVTAQTQTELRQLLQTLTQRIAFLTQGGTPIDRDPRYPPNDSGILGTKVVPDNLTITIAVGSSLFDRRFGLSQLKPIHLKTMPGFHNDQLDPNLCHGDLLLQFCANHPETLLHALRDIMKNTAGSLLVKWKMEGFLPPNILTEKNTTSQRNLLGFKDGTQNLDPEDTQLIDRLVWVQPNQGEPAWAAGGSYQVVRIIRNLVEFWDRTPLLEQEEIMGRRKDNGAPLGMQHEQDIPNYARDPEGKQIPLDAHIRLANPRTEASQENLILRRGYNYSRGVDAAGHMDMGLLFVCFQADLEKGFVTVQNRLKGEPLEEYIKPLGGGFFFALPGITDKNQYFGQSLLQAAG
jgi:deferrochelatase/peroxidase EfeB